jgi:hypothetical protein
MNSLLIRAGGKLILVETGAGDKFDAKKRDIYALAGPQLLDQLAQRTMVVKFCRLTMSTSRP